MKVRIVNEGKPAYMTHITDAETGQEVPGVVRFTMIGDANADTIRTTLTLIHPHLDIQSDADVTYICPCCGQKMKGADGAA